MSCLENLKGKFSILTAFQVVSQSRASLMLLEWKFMIGYQVDNLKRNKSLDFGVLRFLTISNVEMSIHY